MVDHLDVEEAVVLQAAADLLVGQAPVEEIVRAEVLLLELLQLLLVAALRSSEKPFMFGAAWTGTALRAVPARTTARTAARPVCRRVLRTVIWVVLEGSGRGCACSVEVTLAH
ncbi:MAG: hypothetical protein ABS47_21385 [Devosia sp. SCN 66-27]|nr:MAG: hypothetical protein ABS47_21385 [Devosia sp. SCN 66-27]